MDPAGSSRVQRLDPFALPVRFADTDAASDTRMRIVELHRERVIVRRALCGIKMAVSVPLTAYLGVAIRMEPADAGSTGAVAVVLEHSDQALSLTLYRACDGNDVAAEWQAWSRALGLPMLVAQANGGLREPFRRIGGVRIDAAVARRRRRGPLKRRRASMPLRRRPGAAPAAVHRGERELIART
jgi:hypothetical protein